MVEPGDAAAMARAVEALAADPSRAREMGEHGRAYVVEHFNRRKIAGRLRAPSMKPRRIRL